MKHIQYNITPEHRKQCEEYMLKQIEKDMIAIGLRPEAMVQDVHHTEAQEQPNDTQ